jgi:hypothetical protein
MKENLDKDKSSKIKKTKEIYRLEKVEKEFEKTKAF